MLHHGGVGTTAAALRAGIPQIMCPCIFDQFYWAERMSWLGVAPAPLKVRRCTLKRGIRCSMRLELYSKRLKLNYDRLLSSFAFNFDLCHYFKASDFTSGGSNTVSIGSKLSTAFEFLSLPDSHRSAQDLRTGVLRMGLHSSTSQLDLSRVGHCNH